MITEGVCVCLLVCVCGVKHNTKKIWIKDGKMVSISAHIPNVLPRPSMVFWFVCFFLDYYKYAHCRPIAQK